IVAVEGQLRAAARPAGDRLRCVELHAFQSRETRISEKPEGLAVEQLRIYWGGKANLCPPNPDWKPSGKEQKERKAAPFRKGRKSAPPSEAGRRWTQPKRLTAADVPAASNLGDSRRWAYGNSILRIHRLTHSPREDGVVRY